MPKSKVCEQCKGEYQVRLSDLDRSRFCSAKCRNIYASRVNASRRKAARPSLTCAYCGKTFQVKNERAGKAKFCSYQCKYSRNLKYTTDGVEKWCSKGKHYVPLAGFNRDPRGAGGVLNVCKECLKPSQREYSKRRWAEYKHPLVEEKISKRLAQKQWEATNRHLLLKRCRSCGEDKPVSAFHAQWKGKYGVDTTCITCKRIKDRERIKRPQVKAARAAQQHNFRAKKRPVKGSFTHEQFLAKCELWGWRCYLCGKQLSPDTAQREHRIPLSRGGLNLIANIAPACKPCNSSKRSRTEKEFKHYRSYTSLPL